MYAKVKSDYTYFVGFRSRRLLIEIYIHPFLLAKLPQVEDHNILTRKAC